MRKVYICGAHSTGKTTLVDFLRDNLSVKTGDLFISDEVARKVLQENNVTAETQKDKDFFREINLLILKKQHEREIEMERSHNGNNNSFCIFDRGILDPICYLQQLMNTECSKAALNQKHVAELVKEMQEENHCIVFVMKPYILYAKNDNVRIDISDFNDLLGYNDVMKSLMKSLNIKFFCIEDVGLYERAKFVTSVLSRQWPEMQFELKRKPYVEAKVGTC